MHSWRQIFSVEKKNVSNEQINQNIPIFVDKTNAEDHKCGNCLFRIPQNGDAALCTIVEGRVSLKMGTCMFWGYGKDGSVKGDKHEAQMSQKDAGYVEGNFVIQCHTCKFYEDDWCKLWQGKVEDAQCCMAYDNDKLKWQE